MMLILLATALEFFKGFALLHLYWAVVAGAAILAHRAFHLEDELFRKLLHLTAVFAIVPLVLSVEFWPVSIALCATFAAEAYIGAKHSNLEKDVDMKERSDGEQQRSMLFLFATYALIIFVCWGLFGLKWMAVLSVVAWGVGDAFAALVGRRFGRHKIEGRLVQGTKSVEGSLAMFVTSFAATFAIYVGHSDLSSPWLVALVSFWVVLFACVAELFSKDGFDTVACPLAAMSGLCVLASVTGVI